MGMVIVSCAMDVRVGGGYRLEIRHPSAAAPMPFFGKYLEVTANARLVWTNDESASGPITTVTFEEIAGKTRVVLHDLFPSKEAFEESRGAEAGLPEQFDQLDELLATLEIGERAYCAMITPFVVGTLLVSSNSVSGAGPSNRRAPVPRVSGQSTRV
jgi:hypothetical protein